MDVLTLQEVADELRVSYSMVKLLVLTEGLPHFPIGRKKFVRREALEKWVAARELGVRDA